MPRGSTDGQAGGKQTQKEQEEAEEEAEKKESMSIPLQILERALASNRAQRRTSV